MNIHDIYLVSVYVVNKIDYKLTSIDYSGKYVKKTFAIRNKKKYSFDSITYQDLISGNILKGDISDCNVGEEYVNHKVEFIPLVSYLGLSPFETKYNDISRKQVLKLIQEKYAEKEEIQNNEDIIEFDVKKNNVKNNVMHKNKMLCRAMKLINKDKGEDKK